MRQLALRTVLVKDADDQRNLDWEYQLGLSALRDQERLADAQYPSPIGPPRLSPAPAELSLVWSRP